MLVEHLAAEDIPTVMRRGGDSLCAGRLLVNISSSSGLSIRNRTTQVFETRIFTQSLRQKLLAQGRCLSLSVREMTRHSTALSANESPNSGGL